MKSPCTALMFIGVAAAMKALQSGEAPPDPSKVDLPDVPKAMENLPDVTAILESSTQTMSSISSQVAQLQKEMDTVQSQNTMRLQKEKKVFDQKLKEQEDTNKKMAKQNAGLAKDIMKMNKTNADLFKNAAKLQKGNADRREELKLLKEQLEASVGFMSEAYTSTDDSDAKELQVLQSDDERPKASKHISLLAISEELTKDESGSQEVSEAEAAAGKPDEQAESLVAKLEDGVKEMRKQGSETEKKLKTMFLEHFKAGVARHKALLEQGKVLSSTLDSMKKYAERLVQANKHLKATQTKLDSQLRDGSIFLKRLGDVAGKKPEKGVQDLEALNKKMRAAAAN
eukprot:TRINITY_DN57046_c0_g1_i1.p1 TRINITY_DN57046_c0_g1~~TRINITY_DN57046_c0_g1_i1.p1  ORF type:complete len:342 (+),score=109.83 TRINITY_DN57046_c0_g1_i1:45-1070(+)